MSDDPFEALDADADSEGIDDPFAEMAVAELDEEAVWEELEAGTASEPEDAGAGRPATLPGESTPSPDPDAGGAAGDTDGDGDVAVVPKSGYCQGCEHFSSPPRVACTNPGTEIVELVDVDHLRVRNCPVVEGRRDPGDAGEE